MSINKNLWISASAGSGKTKALIDRFLSLLLAGSSAQKILCITFTKAAATEMLSRITDQLSAWVIASDVELEQLIAKLTGQPATPSQFAMARNCFANFLDSQSEIHIGTVHSFCQYVVNKFRLESGISAGSKVIDEFQRARLLEQAKERLIADKFVLENANVQHLLSRTSNFRFDDLLDKILFIDSLSTVLFRSQDAIDSYMAELRLKLGMNARSSVQATPSGYAEASQAFPSLELLAAIQIVLESNRNYLNSPDVNDLAPVQTLRQCFSQPPKVQASSIKELVMTKLGTPRKTLLLKKQRQLYPELIEILNELQALVVSYLRLEAAQEVIKRTAGFLQLGRAFLFHYDQVKQLSGCIDYSDIVKSCLALLENDEVHQWIRYQLSSQFSHIMVDEAQDINLDQWRIVQVFLAEFFYNAHTDATKTLFVVGDPKQAIYSFQGTSPYLFAQMERVTRQFGQQFGISLELVQLNKSFRSDKIILHFVDKVFDRIREKNAEHFFEQTKHVATKQFANASVEIWPAVLGCSAASGDDDEDGVVVDAPRWPAPDSAAATNPEDAPSKLLAAKLAAKIGTLVRAESYKPSDVMILVRKRDVFMDHMIRALKGEGIPVSGKDRLVLNENIAIEDLLALAKFLLRPEDDYNLACLLKSPMLGGGISEEDLFELCQRGDPVTPHGCAEARGESVWGRLVTLAKHECSSPHAPIFTSFPRREVFSKAHAFLSNLITNQTLHSPHALFAHVLDVLMARRKFVGRLGSYVNEILDEFLEICLNFELEHSRSLTAFVHWFSTNAFEIKRDLSGVDAEEANEVRIMTVHAAKGLQARVVILPDTIKVSQSDTDGVLFDAQAGELMCGDASASILAPFEGLSERIKLQTLQEYYRLLYVALTRASERLIVCGWANRKTVPKSSWYALLAECAEQPAPPPNSQPDMGEWIGHDW